MKQTSFKTSIAVFALCAGLLATSCKSKTADTNAVNNDTASANIEPQQDNTSVKPDTMQTQMPQISSDDSLTTMVKDAVKGFPGVTATVSNGEVTLTGNVARATLPKLMMSVQAMHPKKVNNNLTIK